MKTVTFWWYERKFQGICTKFNANPSKKKKKWRCAGGAWGVSENHEYLDQGLYHLGR